MPYVGSPPPSEFLEKTTDRRIYTGDGVETFFEVNFDGENCDVFINGVKLVPTTDFTFDYENQRIALVNFPPVDSKIEIIGSKEMTNLSHNSYTTESFEANEDTDYYYTIQNIDSSYTINVYLNGVRLYPPDFLVDFVYGRINFAEPLKAKDRIEIEYLRPGYRVQQGTMSVLDLSNVDPTYAEDQVLKINGSGQCYFGYSGGVPPGAIVSFAMTDPPPGWLVCDGSLLDSNADVEFIPLYNTIGNFYGGSSGDNFNIPDLRGLFIRSFDDGAGVDSGRTFGSFQDEEFKSHYHYWSVSRGGNGGVGYPIAIGDGNYYGAWGTNTDSRGGVETRPKNIALQYCIKY